MKPDLLKQQAHRAIQKRLGYEFRNMELLQQALTTAATMPNTMSVLNLSAIRF